MKENIKEGSLTDFTKVSPEDFNRTTRLKRWMFRLNYSFNNYYRLLFGYQRGPGVGEPYIALKPLTVSLTKTPVNPILKFVSR